MRQRDLLDLLLAGLLAVLVYVETFGLADPRVSFDEFLGLLRAVDARVYLVLGGVLGLFLVGYITLYLPKQDAGRWPR